RDEVELTSELIGLLDIMVKRAAPTRGRLSVYGEVTHSQFHFWIEHGQHRLEQIAGCRGVVVHEQHSIDADPGGAQLLHRAGLAFADFWNAISAGKIEMDVALSAQDADRKRRRL